MDIDRFINDYPFLSNMVISYKEFNKNVTEEERSFDYTTINNLNGMPGYYEKHKDIYEKIIRNLNFLLNRKYTELSIQDYCRYLNQFIYHKIKKYDLNQFTVNMFYSTSQANIISKGAINSCPYHSYDTTYKEPLNIIKLDNFHENIDDIKSTLENDISQDNSACQKYVCECVKIYKTMHNTYCSNKVTTDKKLKDTCHILEKFKTSYMAYLFDKEGLKDKIPPLDGRDNEDFPRCLSDKPKLELGPTQGPVLGAGVRLEAQSEAASPVAEQSNIGTSLSSSAVVSTMVGIPPFLALIYKFTPVGRIFRSKNNRSMNIFNNIDDQIEKELSYPSHKNAITNSGLATYNVAYGSV